MPIGGGGGGDPVAIDELAIGAVPHQLSFLAAFSNLIGIMIVLSDDRYLAEDVLVTASNKSFSEVSGTPGEIQRRRARNGLLLPFGQEIA